MPGRMGSPCRLLGREAADRPLQVRAVPGLPLVALVEDSQEKVNLGARRLDICLHGGLHSAEWRRFLVATMIASSARLRQAPAARKEPVRHVRWPRSMVALESAKA